MENYLRKIICFIRGPKLHTQCCVNVVNSFSEYTIEKHKMNIYIYRIVKGKNLKKSCDCLL